MVQKSLIMSEQVQSSSMQEKMEAKKTIDFVRQKSKRSAAPG
jgi:hypothetical protein